MRKLEASSSWTTAVRSKSAASSFSPKLMRPLISLELGELESAANMTISPFGASPVATAPMRGPLSFLFFESLKTRWKVSGFAVVVGVKYETLPKALVLPAYSGVGFSPCAASPPAALVFRFGGYSNKKERRCWLLPSFCSLVDELIPAKAVAQRSVDCA